MRALRVKSGTLRRCSGAREAAKALRLDGQTLQHQPERTHGRGYRAAANDALSRRLCDKLDPLLLRSEALIGDAPAPIGKEA